MVGVTRSIRGNIVAGPHSKVRHLAAPSAGFYAPAAWQFAHRPRNSNVILRT